MANNKKKKLSPVQQEYQELQKQFEEKRPVLKNCWNAFWIGGTVCIIGQAIQCLYMYFFPFTEQTASSPTVSTMIFLSMLLTGFGIYDHIAQVAGAGTAVPVTGFGNAVISAAIEHRTEGYVLGVGGNLFKLAGSVVVFGVFSAFVVSLIKILLLKWGGL